MMAALLITAVLLACLASYLFADRRARLRLVMRQDELIRQLDADCRKWQDKALERRGSSPVHSQESPEGASRRGVSVQAMDLRPPHARAQAEWEEEEERKAKRVDREAPPIAVPPLSAEKRGEIAEAARRKVAS